MDRRGMVERLAKLLNGASFNRGLAIGALVGAAIAGSTLWSRLRANPTGSGRGPDTEHVREVPDSKAGPET